MYELIQKLHCHINDLRSCLLGLINLLIKHVGMFLLLRQLSFVISRIVILMEKKHNRRWLIVCFCHGDELLQNTNVKKWKHCSINCPLILCSFWCIVCRVWHRLIQNNIVNMAFCWSKITFLTSEARLSKIRVLAYTLHIKCAI